MYHPKQIVSDADALVAEIKQADERGRLALQPKLQRLLAQMNATGTRVPAKLSDLHDQILEEAIEARFDNLPI